YLDEVCRHKGRGDHRMQGQCPDCLSRKSPNAGLPTYRCIDCFVDDLVCESCCHRRHRLEPLHRIKVLISLKWNGLWFEKTSLHQIGLCVQLNHMSMHCRAPIAGHVSFKVLHTTGTHDVAVDYCGCERQLPPHIQLLCHGWYPVSHKVPTTCASF
ncbi:hypothetical protein ARMSODRAFT_884651, partial [Armillaria solidipes]